MISTSYIVYYYTFLWNRYSSLNKHFPIGNTCEYVNVSIVRSTCNGIRKDLNILIFKQVVL